MLEDWQKSSVAMCTRTMFKIKTVENVLFLPNNNRNPTTNLVSGLFELEIGKDFVF